MGELSSIDLGDLRVLEWACGAPLPRGGSWVPAILAPKMMATTLSVVSHGRRTQLTSRHAAAVLRVAYKSLSAVVLVCLVGRGVAYVGLSQDSRIVVGVRLLLAARAGKAHTLPLSRSSLAVFGVLVRWGILYPQVLEPHRWSPKQPEMRCGSRYHVLVVFRMCSGAFKPRVENVLVVVTSAFACVGSAEP